jgi:cellulose synthase/poly-beta-1,6-N-acetylglucosamine synthase-like glycosyltransferase
MTSSLGKERERRHCRDNNDHASACNRLPELPVTTEADLRAPIPLSVIIPHYNDLEGLRVCWDALLAQTVPETEFEVVVADNNSRCAIEAVQAAAPAARVVPAPIQGAGPARNAGVEASRGRILAFLDSDCVPHPDWLREGMAALTRFDFVGGQVVTFAADPDRPCPVEAFEMVFNFNFRRYIEKLGFTGTGNMFVKRAVFEQVGGFRTGVSEDMEWSYRARAKGFRLGYVERAIVGHPARKDWNELRRRWSRIVDEHFALACESKFGRIRFALKAAMMPASILPHAAKILFCSRLSTFGVKLGAISVLVRLRFWRTGRMLKLALRRRASADRSPGGASGPGLDMRAQR